MSEHKYWRHRWSPQHVTTVDMTGTINAPQWEPVRVLNDAELAAAVTPTREQIAAVLHRHNFDELLLGNIEWDGYTAVCACGWSSEECKMPGDAHEAHSEHAAAHVLALMAELAEGESSEQTH